MGALHSGAQGGGGGNEIEQEKKLFGGDIIGALDLSERLIKNAQFESAGNEEQENTHLKNLASSLSSLLERESLPGWLDLSQVIMMMVLMTKMVIIIYINMLLNVM